MHTGTADLMDKDTRKDSLSRTATRSSTPPRRITDTVTTKLTARARPINLDAVGVGVDVGADEGLLRLTTDN
jgi:hypothetical protein